MAAPSPVARVLSISLLALCLAAVVIGGYKANVTQTEKAKTALETSATSKTTDGKTAALNNLIAVAKTDYMAVIELQGAITGAPESGGLFGPMDSAAMQTRKALDAAAEDDKVKGVLLVIDSPGGTVGMSQELHAAAQRLQQKKPLVVSMRDLAASGGYYTAVAADKIVANRGTLTGSIGVIINGMNLKGLVTDKLGVKAATYKSGAFKDILSPYREARPDEQRLIQDIVDESYADFLSAVIEGRTKHVKDPDEKLAMAKTIRSVADGRVLLGTQALKMGLVDAVGGLETAKGLLQDLIIEHYHMPKESTLPLQPFKNARTWMDVLPFETSTLIPGLAGGAVNPAALTQAGSLQPLLPFSMRYANQPLWVMETFH